jgi:hypothetical protein
MELATTLDWAAKVAFWALSHLAWEFVMMTAKRGHRAATA